MPQRACIKSQDMFEILEIYMKCQKGKLQRMGRQDLLTCKAGRRSSSSAKSESVFQE